VKKQGSGSGSARRDRVAHAMREALTEAIASDIRDPRVHAPTMLTVTKVEPNVDMAVANIYVSIVGEDAVVDAALEGLKKAAGFLRGPIGRRLGLQHAPELRFMLDASIDMSEKLARIVKEDEERARAAGREPTPSPSTPPTPASKNDAEAKPAVDPDGPAVIVAKDDVE
jgi:ribosome-binding factor A